MIYPYLDSMLVPAQVVFAAVVAVVVEEEEEAVAKLVVKAEAVDVVVVMEGALNPAPSRNPVINGKKRAVVLLETSVSMTYRMTYTHT